jgi:hypothetical protein
MKREIFCMKCKERVQAVIKPEELPPREHVKYVDGRALKPMMCDFCGLDIEKDWVVCCFSNYIEGVRPYSPWESEFVEILPADGAAPDPIPPQGVYGLLATGTEDALLKFHLALSMILNFLERRDQTVYCMCMSESLGLAIGAAKKFDVTLQRIEVKDDNELYPVLYQGTHSRWEKGGYVK